MSATDQPDSGTLPGRLEWVEEPSYFGVPTDPSWIRFSDVFRAWEPNPGMDYGAQTATGTSEVQDHFRGDEDPSAELTYDLQRALVDSSDNAQDPAAYGMLRDDQNRLPSSLLIVYRREHSGGNDDSGMREYDVVRGAKVETVEPDLDPSATLPIQMSLSFAPRKVRSYLIHQPSAATTTDVVSSDGNDSMDITIENEDASTTDTFSVNGTTTVTSTETFGDIDSVWLASEPTGDITLTDGSGTTLMEIKGGLSYSDDEQAVDGDRGIPSLGSGSHASAIGTSFEHFVGDRVERPSGTDVRPVITAGGWVVENEFDTASPHGTRHPLESEGNRIVTIDTTVSGPNVGHDNFVDMLTKDQQDMEHELSRTLITFKNTVLTDADPKAVEPEEGRADYSITWSASGEPPIEVTQP
jgi:hypothetical protein